MSKRTFAMIGVAWLLGVCASLASTAQGASFCMARDGRPAATIVVAKEPSRAAAFSAMELRWHVNKITGATLPIVSDAAQVSGPRVLVGESAATRALGLRGDDFQPQEYLIRFLPDALVLIGKDDPKPAGSGIEAHGSAQRAHGKFGRAMSFDGAAAVSVDDCGFDDAEGTLEAWVWLPAKPQSREATIFRLDGRGPWTYHIVRRVANTSRIMYIVYNGKVGKAVTSPRLAEGWHHVCATHSLARGKLELFIDGKSVGAADYTKTTCKSSRLGIGSIVRPGRAKIGNPFMGRIDEVRVSNVARKPTLGALATDAHTTLLLHFDEARGVPRDSSGRRRPVGPPARFDDQGTSYAVHDFLERFCNVRWYGPTELGIICPSAPTLEVVGKDIRRKPVIGYRDPYPVYPGGMARKLLDTPTPREMRVWWARLRAGGEPYNCNHSFYGYYNRFWKKDPQHPERCHPDWFAQGYPGKPPQMCFSNQGFIDQVVQDARDYFDGKGLKPGGRGFGDYFALVPMDNNRWCKCPRCQAQMNLDQKDNEYFSCGGASDYIFNFCNKVARAIAKSHPGKYLATIAYHDYAYYPEHTRVEPNISVQLCLHVRNWWAPGMERNDMLFYRDWVDKEKGRPLYLWLYYCFPEEIAARRGWNCFPGFFAHTAARQIKMFAADGIRGAFLNGIGEQVDTYVTMKLFDDPSQDVDAMLDEFFSRYYGAAAEPMKRMYLRIEDIYSNPAGYPKEIQESKRHEHQTEELAWGALGTEEHMAELGKIMDQARKAARTDVEKRRVAIFDEGVWQYMVEGRRKYVEKKRLAPQIEKMKKQPPPKARVPRIAPSGGDFDRVDWAKAARLAPWRTIMGFPTPRKVEARIAHDGQYLLVQLEERTKGTDLVSRAGVWSGDDWELFFAARRAKPYHQLGIAPNAKYATNGGNWSVGVQVRSITTGSRWTVNAALPLDTLIPGGVKPGGTFYANFFRASPRAKNLLAWSPNFKNSFHELSRLGEFTLE